MKVCVGELGHKLILLPVDVACPPFNSNEQIIWLSSLRVDDHSTTLALICVLSYLSAKEDCRGVFVLVLYPSRFRLLLCRSTQHLERKEMFVAA